MFRRLLCGLALVVIAGCGGSDDPEGPSATIAPADTPGSPTSSTTEALTPEEEVEAAYLRSWKVYAEAVRELDDSGLEDSYAGAALATIRDEIGRLKAANTPVDCSVEHDYVVDIGGPRFASVMDEYVNHCVLLDGSSGQPIEPDPNETVVELYLFERLEGTWKVIGIQDPPQR